jgi:hypothetical protein
MAQGATAGGTAFFNVRIRILIAAMAAAFTTACGGGGGGGAIEAPASASAAPAAAGNGPAAPAPSSSAAAAPAPALATALTAFSAEVANTTVAGNQSVRNVSALSNGGHAVAWTSASGLAVERFDANGAKSGGETRVAATLPADAAITVLTDGSIVVAWTDARGVLLQRFDAQGAASGNETIAVPLASAAQPVLLALDGGAIALGWAQVSDGNVRSQHAQRFDAQLRASGSPVDFAAGNPDQNVSLTLIATSGGDFIAGVTHRYQGIGYLQYRIGGRDVGPLFDMNAGLPEFNTTLAALADGRIALWSMGSNGGYMQMLDAGGRPIGAATPVAVAPETAVALRDGGWVTVTRQMYGQPTIAQRFAASGAPVGASVEAAGGMSRPLITSAVTSGFALAWNFTGAMGDSDVRTQRIAAP